MNLGGGDTLGLIYNLTLDNLTCDFNICLLQCNEKEYVKGQLQKYMKEEKTKTLKKEGTNVHQKATSIESFFVKYYPNYNYVIIVYPEVWTTEKHATNFDLQEFR